MSGAAPPIRVLCAPDKLRGALSAPAAAAALARGVRAAGGAPDELPLADGGEGTLDAFAAAGRAQVEELPARDALGRPRTVRVGRLADGAWLVESAQAIGWDGLPGPARHDVERATSAGVGDLLAALADRGAARVLVALGGSATVDGGCGALHALGAPVPVLLSDLDDGRADPAPLDLAPARQRLAGTTLELLLDVAAPLCGPEGAARLFGPQKGATPRQVERLEARLHSLARRLGVDPRAPGAGAAGGLGAALIALGAAARPGAAELLDLLRFARRLQDADLCLAAEGSVDASTLTGKAVDAVVRACAAADVPCVVLGGRVDPQTADELRARGAAAVNALGPADRPLEQALAAAERELEQAAREAVAQRTSRR